MYHFCLYRVYVAVARLSPVAVSESCPSLWCESFPLQRSPLLQKTGTGAQGLSSCGSQTLVLGLRSRCNRAPLLPSTWNLPRPGIERVSSPWWVGSYPRATRDALIILLKP